MQFFTLLTLATGTLAFPALFNPTLTTPQEVTRAQMRAASGKPAKPTSTSSSSSSSPPAAAGNSSSTACSSQVLALAAGIQSNIDDQNNELTTVNALGMVLAQNPLDVTLYGATQTSLMGFVTKGIVIRENNQKLAPAGNAALDGLAKVAMAQMEELNLTMSLAIPANGAIDTIAAGKTVETLKMDFSGGIEQNKKNLAAAQSGCSSSSSTATTPQTPAKLIE